MSAASLPTPERIFQIIADVVTRDYPQDKPMKVLDIAAGHGVFGISIAQKHPGAEIVALDWQGVLEVAGENAAKAGVADRHSRIVGSAFEQPFGTDYDVVLITNFLHHFNRETCVDVLKKVHAALKPGGRAITLEFIPNAASQMVSEGVGGSRWPGADPAGPAGLFSFPFWL